VYCIGISCLLRVRTVGNAIAYHFLACVEQAHWAE